MRAVAQGREWRCDNFGGAHTNTHTHTHTHTRRCCSRDAPLPIAGGGLLRPRIGAPLLPKATREPQLTRLRLPVTGERGCRAAAQVHTLPNSLLCPLMNSPVSIVFFCLRSMQQSVLLCVPARPAHPLQPLLTSRAHDQMHLDYPRQRKPCVARQPSLSLLFSDHFLLAHCTDYSKMVLCDFNRVNAPPCLTRAHERRWR